MGRRVLLSLAVLAACRSESSPRPAAGPSARAPVLVIGAVHDAGAHSAALVDAGGPRIDVDLLHWTRAQVAVSSNVDNPRDYPEHLVDGRGDTAWNSKTGEGGTISFRVPSDTYIRQIELSVGFDKKTAKGDLFTMNHRIKRVTVRRVDSHPELVIGEFTLDINERLPQPIPIDKPGGFYEIVIEETVPGTKASWSETVVSELHVMGDPGASKVARWRMPAVVVGVRNWIAEDGSTGLTAESVLDRGFSSTSPEALCVVYAKTAAVELAQLFEVDHYPGPPAPPHCTVGRPLVPSFRAEQGVRGARQVTVNAALGLEKHLVIELDGEVLMPAGGRLAREREWLDGATTESATIERVRVEDKQVIVSLTHTQVHERYCLGTQTIGLTFETALDLRCALDATPMTCTRIERRKTCSGQSCVTFGL